MKSCAFCGRENDVASRFCIDCGKPLNPSAARGGPPSRSGNFPAVGRPTPALGAVAQPYGVGWSSGIGPSDPHVERVAEGGAPTVPLTSDPVSALAGASSAMDLRCPHCGRGAPSDLPFCGHCGSRISAAADVGTCSHCGSTYARGVDLFCSRCANRVGDRVSVNLASDPTLTQAEILGTAPLRPRPRLSLLGDNDVPLRTYTLDQGEALIGRGDADIRFDFDQYMSPIHARLELRDGQLFLRDLGSRNGSWVFIDQVTKLVDGDIMLIGSQLLRFRRLGYPGPQPPEADATRRMGSNVPLVDIAVIEQLRADGSVRDTFHLSPGRSIGLGREAGDWLFAYDATMSGRHAEIRSEDSDFYVHDANSRNGVAMAVRGERPVRPGQRMLIGDQLLRVESL